MKNSTSIDGIEVEMEIVALEESGDALEVEHAIQHADVVFRGGYDLDLEGMIFH